MMKIENLQVSYDKNRVIDNLSLEIGDGITCIMGESGCGKTTLLHTIAGLIEPEGGEIVPKPLRPAVMFQEERLFPWLTVLDNVEAICGNRELALELLEKVELKEIADKMPSELSGGMKRRVALARALAFDSDCIILDEPFKGLDEALTQRMAQLLRTLKVPVLIATHDSGDAKRLNAQVIVMRKS